MNMEEKTEYVFVRFYDEDVIEIASNFLKENSIENSTLNLCANEDDPSEVYITTKNFAQNLKEYIAKNAEQNEDLSCLIDVEIIKDFARVPQKINIPQSFVGFVENSIGFREIFFTEVRGRKFAQVDFALDCTEDMYCNVLGYEEPVLNLIFKTKKLAMEYIENYYCLPILDASSIDDSSVDEFVDIPTSVSGEFSGFRINNNWAFVGWYEEGETYTIYIDEIKKEEVFGSVFDAREIATKLQQANPTSKVTIKSETNDIVDF